MPAAALTYALQYQRDNFKLSQPDSRTTLWTSARAGKAFKQTALFGNDRNSIPIYEQIYALAGLAQFYRCVPTMPTAVWHSSSAKLTYGCNRRLLAEDTPFPDNHNMHLFEATCTHMHLMPVLAISSNVALALGLSAHVLCQCCRITHDPKVLLDLK
jgi:hypothetical protein